MSSKQENNDLNIMNKIFNEEGYLFLFNLNFFLF
jgi:hypothetical protein